MATSKIPIRKDKDGFILDSSGDKIVTGLFHNKETKRWDLPVYLGDKYTLDNDGNISKEYSSFMPNEQYYIQDIVKHCVMRHFGITDVKNFKIYDFSENTAYAIFIHNDKKHIVGYEFGESFDEDGYAIRELEEEQT